MLEPDRRPMSPGVQLTGPYDSMREYVDALEAIIADTAAIEEPWEQARVGLATFLDVCMRPDVQRIARKHLKAELATR